jgi:hypothetical protein
MGGSGSIDSGNSDTVFQKDQAGLHNPTTIEPTRALIEYRLVL